MGRGFRVVNLVEGALWVPDFGDTFRQYGGACAGWVENRIELADPDGEEPRGNFKHTRHHAIDWKIRAQRLLVEVVVFLALFLRPISDFPRLELADGLAGFRSLVLGELFVLGEKRRLHAGVEILDKAKRGAAVFCHPAEECEIREMRVTKDDCLFVAES